MYACIYLKKRLLLLHKDTLNWSKMTGKQNIYNITKRESCKNVSVSAEILSSTTDFKIIYIIIIYFFEHHIIITMIPEGSCDTEE